ncbi:MAG: polyhydroxyalkanoate synthesis repressor PhaR [Rhodospirillaceae bacterium]|nr:MAG: polyhydroxyalkanoate synthesis repressor PhaR [Rhodospirillaceae bacterium]
MMMEKNVSDSGSIMIKKYANRRLYNTATSSYVTLGYLCRMVKDGADFVVHDAKTGEDITRSVLTQIIVEEEAKGQNLLPIGFLRQLISLYGDSLGGVVPRYLEYSMQAFAQHEEQMRSLMQNALDGLFPFNQFEEMGKQNMAFFESALRMFTPFYGNDGGTRLSTPAPPLSPSQPATPYEKELEDLRLRLNAMQQQLDILMSRSNARE